MGGVAISLHFAGSDDEALFARSVSARFPGHHHHSLPLREFEHLLGEAGERERLFARHEDQRGVG